MKTCSKCKTQQSLDNFCKDSKSKDGYQTQCKTCKSLWAKNNKHIIQKNRIIWSKNNPQRVRSNSLNSYHKNKVRSNVSRMIRRALTNYSKEKSTFDALGYTLDDLRSHLEKRFTEGMNWENYGQWHIDHIIPQSALPYSSMSDVNFKKCWSLENLQPLWAIDNKKKSNKII